MRPGTDTTRLSAARAICRGCESVLRVGRQPMACGAREDQAIIDDHPVTTSGFCPKKKHAEVHVPITIQATDATAIQENTKPSMYARLTSGITGVAKALAGVDAASPEIEGLRLSKCEPCEHNQPGVLGRYCHLCGCYIDLKVKVASEQCPDTPPRWKAVPGVKTGGCSACGGKK